MDHFEEGGPPGPAPGPAPNRVTNFKLEPPPPVEEPYLPIIHDLKPKNNPPPNTYRPQATAIKQESAVAGEDDEDADDPVDELEYDMALSIYKSAELTPMEAASVKKMRRTHTHEEMEMLAWADLEALHVQMLEAKASFPFTLLEGQVNPPAHTKGFYMKQTKYWALLGIKKVQNEDQTLLARPLCFAGSTVNEVEAQYDLYTDAIKCLYGFSEKDTYVQTIYYSRMGLGHKNNVGRWRYKYRRIFAAYSEEQLDELLRREDVVGVRKKRPMKAPIVVPRASTYRMNLTNELRVEDMIGIVFAQWNKTTGEVSGRVLRVYPKTRELGAQHCALLACDVWGFGRHLNRVPMTEKPFKKVEELTEAVQTYNLVMEFREGDQDGEIRKALLSKQRQCPYCLKMFPYAQQKEELVYSSHRAIHRKEREKEIREAKRLKKYADKMK